MAQKNAQFLPAQDNDITDVYSTTFIDESLEQLTAADQAANAAIEQLNSLAENAKTVRIMRQTGTGKESMQFVMSEPADKYTVDQLIEIVARDYGGGDYRFMIYNEKGKLAANKLICIAEKNKHSDSINTGDGGMAGVFSQYMNKQDRLLESLLNSNNGQNSDRESFMREMVIMKQLFQGENQAPQNDPISQMKGMLEMMTMLKDASNPAPEKEETGFAGILDKSMPLLTAIVQGVNRPQQNQQNTRRQNPHQKPQPKQENNPMLNTVAKELLKELTAKTEPQQVAQNITAQVPDVYLDKLVEFLNDVNLINKLIAIEPAFGGHDKWLVDVIEWSKWHISEPSKFDNSDLTAEPEQGHNSDINNSESNNVQNNIEHDGDT